MMFHLSGQSLIEEYAIARQEWSLSMVDLSEIARNRSVDTLCHGRWSVVNTSCHFFFFCTL